MEIPYPTNNPTEVENELNYLQMVSNQIYIAAKKGLLDIADAAIVREKVLNQKEIILGLQEAHQ